VPSGSVLQLYKSGCCLLVLLCCRKSAFDAMEYRRLGHLPIYALDKIYYYLYILLC
jgi:hypothetical protein